LQFSRTFANQRAAIFVMNVMNPAPLPPPLAVKTLRPESGYSAKNYDENAPNSQKHYGAN
jgi:hypothetical protein